MTQPRSPAQLPRTLNLWQLTTTGVGIVIGAGIYVLIGEAAKDAGSGVWMAFIVAAVLSGLTGLSYAELGGMFPRAGAEYEFARRAFNDVTGFLTGWMMIAGNIIGAGAVALGFAHYLRHFVDVPVRLGALGLLAVVTALVAAGMQRSIWVTVSLVVLQVGGLVIVIIAGAPQVGDHSLVEGASASGVMSAAALVFFAFIGFDEVITLSEDTKDAERNVPRALLLALAISTLLYVLVGVAAVSAVGAGALAASDTPLALVLEDEVGSRASDVIAFIALASTTNTTLLLVTAGSRLIFGMSRDASLPPVFSTIGRRGGAPYLAAIATMTVAGGFAMLGDIGLVASVTDFAVYVMFITVNVALIRLRFTSPDAPRTFRVPGAIRSVPFVPIAGAAVVVVMMGFLDPWAWLLGFAALGAGAVAWLASAGARSRARARMKTGT